MLWGSYGHSAPIITEGNRYATLVIGRLPINIPPKLGPGLTKQGKGSSKRQQQA